MNAITSDSVRAVAEAYYRGPITNRAVPIGRQAEWQVRTIEKIASLADLTENWDSYGSPAIADELIDRAIALIDHSEMEGVAAPRVLPVSGGGIHLEWQIGDKTLEIELRRDGGAEVVACENDEPVNVDARSLDGFLSWLV